MESLQARRKQTLGHRGVLCVLALAQLWLLPAAAGGQQSAADEDRQETPAGRTGPNADPSPEIEEILVRGQASQGIETDAAVSVTAFGASDLAALGVEDVADLAQFTPNLEIPKFGSTTVSFFIRGVGLNDFTAAASTSVAIYYDDVSLNLPQFALAKTFDIEQVDVLKGPIGAGAGRNASAGAIRIYSRKPTGDFGAFVRSEYTIGSFRADDTEGAIEFPIIPDVFSARLAFRVSHQDPYVTNGCGDAPPVGLGRVQNPAVQVQNTVNAVCNENVNDWQNSVPDPYAAPGSAGALTEFNNYIVYPSSGSPNPVDAGPQYQGEFGSDLEHPTGLPYRISYLPAGLPAEVNDADSWAARGTFRFQPPDTDMDWLLIVHGGRTDEMSPVGQTITIGGGYFGGPLGGIGYQQPEIKAEYDSILAGLQAQGMSITEATPVAQDTLEQNLVKRLDTEPFRGDYDLIGDTTVDTYGASLRGDWELASGQITTISSYEYYDVSEVQDFDFIPKVVLESEVEQDAWQFVQSIEWQDELRDEPFRWSLGVYYLMDELDYVQTQIATTVPSRFRPYIQKTWSVNGGFTFAWDFADDFTLEGGARYNWERKDLDVTGSEIGGLAICPDVPGSLNLVNCTDSATFKAPTGQISLRYHFNEDVSTYAKYTHGWKGAQFNASTAPSLSEPPISLADPETIDSFEVGMHGAWWDGRVALDLALFHYTYENYQVFIVKNDFGSIPQRVVLNANDVIYYGAEATLGVSPVENLNLTARFGWNESEFLDFSRQQVYEIPQPQPEGSTIVQVLIDYTGNSVPNAPEFKVSGTVDYTLDMGRYGSLIPRYDIAWTDDVFFDASEGRGDPRDARARLFDLPSGAIGQQAFFLHAVRLTYRSPTGNVEVAGWARNLTDEIYKVYAFNAQGIGFVGNFVGQPRTYGISLMLSW